MELFKVNGFNVEKIKLDVPSLQDISDALSTGLIKNFFEVDVEIVDCPDLTQNPFNLSSKGLGGNTSVVQVGDPVNATSWNLQNYNFCDIPKALNLQSSCIIGAGGGCGEENTDFNEMVANVQLDEHQFTNNSKYLFSTNKTLEGVTVGSANQNEKRFCIIGNFFVSQGEQGKVIRISCKKRIGADNFSTAVINALNSKFSQPVALGTIFQLKKGKAKTHLAPGKPTKPVKNTEDLNRWLLFPIIEPSYLALGTILSRCPTGWNMLLEHFHGHNGKIGGHYHYDVTPEDVEYEAYVMPAETLCSIDKAEITTTLITQLSHKQ